MENIRILEGSYKIRGKDQDLSGMVFPLVEGFKIGAVGGYVTWTAMLLTASQIVTSRSR